LSSAYFQNQKSRSADQPKINQIFQKTKNNKKFQRPNFSKSIFQTKLKTRSAEIFSKNPRFRDPKNFSKSEK